ncbi:hypothetical protein D3C76_1776380 [compost metagenome]
MYSFFGPLYHSLSLEQAIEQFDDFYGTMSQLYKRVNHIKMQVIRRYIKKQTKEQMVGIEA